MIYTARQIARAFPGRSPEYLTELRTANLAMESGLRRLLGNPQTDLETKKKIVQAVLGKELSGQTLNLIYFLLEIKAVKRLTDIAREYEKILAAEKVVLTGKLTTVYPVEDQELKTIETRIAEKIGQPVMLERIVNPAILGGAIISIDGQTVDKSFASKLKALR